MTSGTRKTSDLLGQRATANPTLEPLAGLRMTRWPRWASVLAAQDTICHAASRVLVSHTMQGISDTMPVPGDIGSPNGQPSQTYPTNTWVEVGTHRVRIMPGSVLEVHGWYLPAGQTQRNDSGTWNGDGRTARVRVSVTWEAGGSSDGPRTYSRTMEGSPLENGAAPTPLLAHVRHLDPITLIAPDGFLSSFATIASFSEWPEATILLEVSGAPRIGDLSIVERFLVHVDDVTDGEASSMHSYQIGAARPQQPQTQGPQTEAAGANEPRFGTHRLLDVANRQRDRVGPHLLSWAGWEPDEDDSNLLEGRAVSSTTFVDLFNNTLTTWSADNPGWLVDGGAYAAEWALSDPTYAVTGRSLIPVRVEVDGVTSGGGFDVGVLRLQSGERDFVDVVVPAGLRSRTVQFGWLEVQREGDGPGALLQAFGRVEDALDTMRIYNIDVWFGHFD